MRAPRSFRYMTAFLDSLEQRRQDRRTGVHPHRSSSHRAATRRRRFARREGRKEDKELEASDPEAAATMAWLMSNEGGTMGTYPEGDVIGGLDRVTARAMVGRSTAKGEHLEKRGPSNWDIISKKKEKPLTMAELLERNRKRDYPEEAKPSVPDPMAEIRERNLARAAEQAQRLERRGKGEEKKAKTSTLNVEAPVFRPQYPNPFQNTLERVKVAEGSGSNPTRMPLGEGQVYLCEKHGLRSSALLRKCPWC